MRYLKLIYKKILFLTFFTWISLIFPQQKQIDEIDSLLSLSDKTTGKNNLKSLEYAKQASLIAEKINNSEKKAYSYAHLAKVLSFMAKNSQSFQYLDKAYNEKYTSKDLILQANIKEVRAQNYLDLGLMQNMQKEYISILEIIKDLHTVEAEVMKFRAYGNIASYYYEIKDYNSAIRHIESAEALVKKIDTSRSLKNELPETYILKGYVYLDNNKTDSAYKYFKRALNRIEKTQGLTRYSQYLAFADYYFHIKDYNTAIEYYIKALKDMEDHHMDSRYDKMQIYKQLSECYDILKDPQNKNFYLQKYNNENEKTNNDSSVNMQAAINNILNETESTRIKDKKKHNQNLYLIVSLCLLVLSVSTYYYLNKVKTRNKIIDYKEKELETNKTIISEKENEAALLRKQLNESFEDLVHLAKTNNSEFLARFQDVYPDFTEKLLSINPSLATSELQFCALLTFNFTSKEIAQFTHITPRTVENKKTRIRKRLNIPLDRNINIWLRELLE